MKVGIVGLGFRLGYLARVFTALEALLAGEQLDLLMIGSPNHMHLDHIRIGLEHGVKIFPKSPSSPPSNRPMSWRLIGRIRP
jgi:hypothetical protein